LITFGRGSESIVTSADSRIMSEGISMTVLPERRS
jgi:hypothetical protein